MLRCLSKCAVLVSLIAVSLILGGQLDAQVVRTISLFEVDSYFNFNSPIGHSAVEVEDDGFIVSIIDKSRIRSGIVRVNVAGKVEWATELTDHDTVLYPSLPDPKPTFVRAVLPLRTVDGNRIQFTGVALPSFLLYGGLYFRYLAFEGQEIDTVGGFADSVLSLSLNDELAFGAQSGLVRASVQELGVPGDTCRVSITRVTESGRLNRAHDNPYELIEFFNPFVNPVTCAAQSVDEDVSGNVAVSLTFLDESLNVYRAHTALLLWNQETASHTILHPATHGDTTGFGGRAIFRSSTDIALSYLYSEGKEDENRRIDVVVSSVRRDGAASWTRVIERDSIDHGIVELLETRDNSIVLCGNELLRDPDSNDTLATGWFVRTYSPTGEEAFVLRSRDQSDDQILGGASLSDAGDLVLTGRAGDRVFVAVVDAQTLSVGSENPDPFHLDLAAKIKQ